MKCQVLFSLKRNIIKEDRMSSALILLSALMVNHNMRKDPYCILGNIGQDQPVHLHSLVRAFAVCLRYPLILKYISPKRVDSDLTAQAHMLTWTFVVRWYDKAPFSYIMAHMYTKLRRNPIIRIQNTVPCLKLKCKRLTVYWNVWKY